MHFGVNHYMETEVWKEIDKAPDYKISSFGRVEHNGFLTIQYKHPRGYSLVALWINNKRQIKLVHRLVANAFLPQSNKTQVNHINGVKTDNRVENLEWVTPKENMEHARKIFGNFSARGMNAGSSKLTDNDVIDIRTLYAKGGITMQFLSDKYNVSKVAISKIINWKTWKHVEVNQTTNAVKNDQN